MPYKKRHPEYQCLRRLPGLAAAAMIMFLVGSGCSFESKDNVFGRSSIFGSRQEQETSGAPVSTLSKTTDIHYSGKYCLECHEKVPQKGGGTYLRYGGDFKQLCRCHYGTTVSYIHPVDIEPTEKLKARIPASLPLQDGKITCSTCHDIVVQCVDKPTERVFLKEQKFLRDAPFETRTSLCFRCHDIEEYQRYNPHKQLNADNEIVAEKCLYCHAKVPDVKQSTYKDVKLIGNMEVICIRCHAKEPQKIFHAKHLRKPTAEVLATMQHIEEQYAIVLPLDPDGKITCATCHNPHEKGVIPDKRAGAVGAGELHRQRLSGNLCIKCHPLREITTPENFLPPNA